MTERLRSQARERRAMFEAVAPRYDRMNALLSFGADSRWRGRAVQDLASAVTGWTLDLCTGTGDLALEALKGRPGTRVVGVDFAEEMLARARDKARRAAVALPLAAGDAQALPFGNEVFDNVTVGFGLRNVPDLEMALDEVHRVLRPGGRLVCLEMTPLPRHWWGRLFRFYFARVAPLVSVALSSAPAAYRYLPASVERFPRAGEFKQMLEKRGFVNVYYYLLAAGTTAVHVAEKARGGHTSYADK